MEIIWNSEKTAEQYRELYAQRYAEGLCLPNFPIFNHPDYHYYSAEIGLSNVSLSTISQEIRENYKVGDSIYIEAEDKNKYLQSSRSQPVITDVSHNNITLLFDATDASATNELVEIKFNITAAKELIEDQLRITYEDLHTAHYRSALSMRLAYDRWQKNCIMRDTFQKMTNEKLNDPMREKQYIAYNDVFVDTGNFLTNDPTNKNALGGKLDAMRAGKFEGYATLDPVNISDITNAKHALAAEVMINQCRYPGLNN